MKWDSYERHIHAACAHRVPVNVSMRVWPVHTTATGTLTCRRTSSNTPRDKLNTFADNRLGTRHANRREKKLITLCLVCQNRALAPLQEHRATQCKCLRGFLDASNRFLPEHRTFPFSTYVASIWHTHRHTTHTHNKNAINIFNGNFN